MLGKNETPSPCISMANSVRPMIADMVQFGQLTQVSYMLVGPLGSGKQLTLRRFSLTD
jgi:hypothetical protein